MVISPDSQFFEYFKSENVGRAPGSAPRARASTLPRAVRIAGDADSRSAQAPPEVEDAQALPAETEAPGDAAAAASN